MFLQNFGENPRKRRNKYHLNIEKHTLSFPQNSSLVILKFFVNNLFNKKNHNNNHF
jgi:hypothetical protein